MITTTDQLAVAAEDEVEQADAIAVLFKYLLSSLKELLGELRRLNNLFLCCTAGSSGG